MTEIDALASYLGEHSTDTPPEPRQVCCDCGADYPAGTCWCLICGGTSFEEQQ